MSKYLIKTTEMYRCDTEKEANELIEEAKRNHLYTVVKSSSEIRESKATEQEWRRVIITKAFNIEKEPTEEIYISYDNERE